MPLEKMICGENYTTELIKDNINGLIDSSETNAAVIKSITSQKLLVGLGDSITENYSSFFYSFAHASNGQIIPYSNQGVDGNTSTQVLSRVDDVPNEADIVTLMCTTNDVSSGITIEQHTSNIIAIVDALRGKGVEVIGLLAPPRDESSTGGFVGIGATTDLFNQTDYVTYLKLGVTCLDPFREFRDPNLGQWVFGASDDGTHPNAITEYKVGVNLWEQYKEKSYATLNPSVNGVGVNDNANFINTYGGTIKPVNFNLAAAVNSSVIAPASGILGNQWHVNHSDTYNDMTSDRFPLVMGDVYMAVITYEHTINSGSAKVSAYWESDQSKRRYIINSSVDRSFDIPKTKFVTFITLNPDTPSPELNMRFRVKVEEGVYNIDIKISEVQLFNITELGWEYPLPLDAQQ